MGKSIRNLDLKKMNAFRQYSIIVGLIGLLIVFSMLSEYFFVLDNFMNILRQLSILGVVSAGMTIVIISGGIDLSVGSFMAWFGCIAASILSAGVNSYLTVILVLLLGFGIGSLEGYFISRARIPSFVVTLGLMTVARGAAYAMTYGYPIFVSNQNFLFLGRGTLWGIPVSAFITLVVFILVGFILKRTTFGRNVYAIGGNLGASKLAGINIHKTSTIIYGINCMMAAFGGILLTARLTSAQPAGGEGMEMEAISAVVLGGTGLAGGKGGMIGTIIGVFILAVLSNGLDLLNVVSYWKMIIQGAVLIFAVWLGVQLEGKKEI